MSLARATQTDYDSIQEEAALLYLGESMSKKTSVIIRARGVLKNSPVAGSTNILFNYFKYFQNHTFRGLLILPVSDLWLDYCGWIGEKP